MMKLLKINEAAEILGVNKRIVYYLEKKGYFIALKVGSSIRVTEASVKRYADMKYVICEGRGLYHVLDPLKVGIHKATLCRIPSFCWEDGEDKEWYSGGPTPKIITERPRNRRVCKLCERKLKELKWGRKYIIGPKASGDYNENGFSIFNI
jgi:excisionase family DNA binding protein